jgi:hypothetical protein
MQKSLDRKLAAIHSDPGCREFILADAKDADMALGLGAPGESPERHNGEVAFKTLEAYREQMRIITRSELVDIMLMSASSNYALTMRERLFDSSRVTPAVRANDTTDIHLARGASYHESPSRPLRTASLDHIQCGHIDCAPEDRARGADLGLYSVTFNNDLSSDLATLERFREFREEAERKGFRYFLEVFDPNVPSAVAPDRLGPYINDMITRMLAGIAPPGRPLFLKIVYHGPKALEELAGFDPHLVVGILGGSAGTTRDAFQLLHDAQKYGARVALFGRKINHAENQLAFVHFLRLIVEGQIGPQDAVKAYHAVLARLEIPPRRSLADDLLLTDHSMSYSGASGAVVVRKPEAPARMGLKKKGTESAQNSEPLPLSSGMHKRGAAACACQTPHAATTSNGQAGNCSCSRPRVTESAPVIARRQQVHNGAGAPAPAGTPDFPGMTTSERLEYHRRRLGLGR